ncbi:hypothetical protein NPIL_484421 [Nephila pilipes]|uniref:Uncharacterized protein n=1 Tax=Nephila pilipes TaxID=299642 RepID=A0A8X6Q182_NEPPI|nr:hypothetical protein NPIL_484421 [Nephila pilipes]
MQRSFIFSWLMSCARDGLIYFHHHVDRHTILHFPSVSHRHRGLFNGPHFCYRSAPRVTLPPHRETTCKEERNTMLITDDSCENGKCVAYPSIVTHIFHHRRPSVDSLGCTIPNLCYFFNQYHGKIHGFVSVEGKRCCHLGVLGCLAFYHWLVAGPAKPYPPPHGFHITVGFNTRLEFKHASCSASPVSPPTPSFQWLMPLILSESPFHLCLS